MQFHLYLEFKRAALPEAETWTWMDWFRGSFEMCIHVPGAALATFVAVIKRLSQ